MIRIARIVPAVLILFFFCAAPSLAQNSCRNTCGTKFPGANQNSQLNACYASCPTSPVAAPKPNVSQSQTQSGNAWNMNAAQRQIAVQNAEVQQSQQALNNARVQEMNAQMDQIQAQQQANVAASDATQAGLQTGMIEGQYAAAKNNYDKRVNMVRDAFNGPKAKSYTNRPTSVALADPFAEPAPLSGTSSDTDFAVSLAVACLEMGDKDHPGARVVACKAEPSACKKMPALGFYPLLQDGRLIDSVETLAIFKKSCADPALPMSFMSEAGTVAEVR